MLTLQSPRETRKESYQLIPLKKQNSVFGILRRFAAQRQKGFWECSLNCGFRNKPAQFKRTNLKKKIPIEPGPLHLASNAPASFFGLSLVRISGLETSQP